MRSNYVLSYDISDPGRWRRVHRIALDFGDPLQYSVFLCELGDRDRAVMEGRLREAMSEREDQVLLIRIRFTEDIGQVMETYGRPVEIPDRRYLIY